MRRVLSIMVLTILILQFVTVGFAAIKPENGIAYVLLPKDLTGIDGVYRLNTYLDPTYAPLTSSNGKRIFDLNFGGAVVVNGLSANQDGKIYLFVGPVVTGVYTPVDEVGWLPSGQFDADSPAYIKLIGQTFNAGQISQDASSGLSHLQYTWGTTNYDNDFWDDGPFPTSPHYSGGWFNTHAKYTKGNFTDAAGNSYNYKFQPINPPSHKNTPLWNGPGASSAGIQHPTDQYKVILPNKWGGISWFAFGSPNAPAADVGKLADGRNGRLLITNNDFRLKHDNTPSTGNVPICSPYWDAQYISTIVKRVYEKRDRSLDLYAYLDNVIPPAAAPYSSYPSIEASNVLTATDLKITEQYGKTCADGCIPGGALNPEAIGKIESCVQVFTATTGRRYAFNPYGKKSGPYGSNDAALRVVSGGTTYNLDVNAANIRNIDYFTGPLSTPIESATILGVSSNFQAPTMPITKSPDYIYASIASKFCIQDSWWGNGGIAYEYYAKDVTAGSTFLKNHIYRLDYMTTNSPTPEDVGEFTGDVDAISVDGQGNLYILTTELACPNLPEWPDENGLPQGPTLVAEDPTLAGNGIVSHADFLSLSSWMRPGIGTSDSVIPTPTEDDDYITVRFKQYVQKVCRKYTPSAGGGFSLSTVEDRGYVDAGFDVIERNLKYSTGGVFSWRNDWHHEASVASRSANLDAEFAVVNIAARPTNQNTNPQFSICRVTTNDVNAVPTADKIIDEDTEATFKIEGYRPFDDANNVQNLVPAADIPGLGGLVYVNLIPPYQDRDEDGDGVFGGFESGMFESPSYQPTITWHVDMIENNAAYASTDVIASGSWTSAPNTLGDQRRFTFKFPQPGNYAVYADISYNYFNYNNLRVGGRPEHLFEDCLAQNATTTKKIIYHVQSASNQDTVNDGFITDITLSATTFNQNVTAAGSAGTGYFFKEDNSPESLSFSFNAKFVSDANSLENTGLYEAHNGVGVWNYGAGGHVYNYVSDGVYNDNYNPGKIKFANNPSEANYQYGTRVDEAPNSKDLKAIKWYLYIYPTYDGATAGDFTPVIPNTGIIYASGTCEFGTSTIVNPAENKYNISVDISDNDLPAIATPIDPGKYKVRLELEYPRVAWHEHSNATDPGLTGVQFRSIIPGSPIKGRVTTVDHAMPSDTARDAAATFAAEDFWYLGARDTTIIPPTFNNVTIGGAAITQIATHTTGDPVSDCIVSMNFEDNNPNSEFRFMKINYERPNNNAERNPTDKSDGNTVDGVMSGSYGPKPVSPMFWGSNNYSISASYSFTISDYGSGGMFSPSGSFKNWIGSLSFSLEGQLIDGLGAVATAPAVIGDPHEFSKDATDPRLVTSKCGLERYDNDPASITVELISQADNRRWQFTLGEGANDLVQNPSVKENLAMTTLNLVVYKLDGTTVSSPPTIELTGSSNNPIILGEPLVSIPDMTTFTTGFVDALPKVRRSTRLQISVRVDDNVDYQDLRRSEISVLEGNKALLATTSMNLASKYKSATGSPSPISNPLFRDPEPSGRYFIDMPMTVDASQTHPATTQVSVRIATTDSSGNEKILIIPVEIVDSTFDARVLESSENRN